MSDDVLRAAGRAALAAVDVDGVRVAPPERPIDEDLEQADMFGEED